MSNNPYEKIYDELNITITQETTFEEAQQIAKHLGYIYNTFGLIVKDFISMLGYKFRAEHGQNSINGNKKDKRNIIKDIKSDKKTKLDEKTAQQQLEGKNKTAPHSRLIKEIQNYKSSNQSQLILQQQLIKSKLLQLRQEKKALQSQSSENISKPQSQQKQPQTTLSNPTKISFRKKNAENVVINISSQDEQKEQDDTNGVKTRAQLRGVTKSFLRPQRLLKRGRGKRGRPRKIGRVSRDEQESSESSEEKSLKGSSYPLDPNDPFTIIYNVPYRPKNNDSQSKQTIGIVMSKKQRKSQKILQKMRESQQNSSFNSEQDSKKSLKPIIEQEKPPKPTNLNNNIQSINFKKNFIQKVKASYMQEKQAIKERLQNLDKQYKGEKVDGNYSMKNKKLQLDSQEQEYEQMEEQEQQEGQQFSGHGGDNDDNEDIQHQQQQGEQQQYYHQNKHHMNNNSLHHIQNEKQIHLQWLNNTIQQQFEQNLRMNQQINNTDNDNNDNVDNQNQNQENQEDEYEQEVYLTQHQHDNHNDLHQQQQKVIDNNKNHGDLRQSLEQKHMQQQQLQQQYQHSKINNNNDNNDIVSNNAQQQQNNDKQIVLQHQQQGIQEIQKSNYNNNNDKNNSIVMHAQEIGQQEPNDIIRNQQQRISQNNNKINQQQHYYSQQQNDNTNINNSNNPLSGMVLNNKNTDQQVLRVLEEFQSDSYDHQYDNININLSNVSNVSNSVSNNNNIMSTNNNNTLPPSQISTKTATILNNNKNNLQSVNSSNNTIQLNTATNNNNDYSVYSTKKANKQIEIIELQ